MRLHRWLLAATALTVGSVALRSRANRWGASDDEVGGYLPGDDLVPDPTLGYTRAITIDAPCENVWPWLVQIGHGRGGLYSYDWAENLVGCDLHSVDEIHAQWQDLVVGDLVRLGPEGYPAFSVVEIDAPRTLVLVGAETETSAPPTSGAALSTWQWSLRPTNNGGTRLLVRQRLRYPNSQAAMWRVVEPITFVMEHKMLRGIKRRAEDARH